MMFDWTVVLCLCILLFSSASAQKDCTDLRGRLVSHGIHYVPGPDTCTLCVCDNGLPLECKAVLCSPPQDCRSFRVGVTCCEFICLDDVVKPSSEVAEANMRMVGCAAAAVALCTVLVIGYHVRKSKRRRATHADDQRSLTSIGYISGSMAYMSSTCETVLGAWKPPGNYLPRGEAPPPYDEVVALCRAENARLMSEGPYHRSYPSTMDAMTRPDDVITCNGHGYVNMPRPVPQQGITIQISNSQTCYNAPLLQPAEVREGNQMPHYPLAPNMSGLPHRARLTGSLGAISGRLSVPREPDHERPHNVPGFYTSTHIHAALHRTIPRISTAIEALELGAFRRAETSSAACGAGEVRRSFHRPAAAARRDTGRSVPRHLDLASAADSHLDESSLRLAGCGGRSRAQSSDNVGGSPPPALPAPPIPPAKPDPTPAAPAPPPQATLPLTVDKPSCECTYAAGGGSMESAGSVDEPDDYRSECENCKSANSSRWVLEEGWADEAEEGGTQTLQRRAPPPAPPAPATATLPQPVTKQARTAMGPPSNWENWFNTIPDSDSESEEE